MGGLLDQVMCMGSHDDPDADSSLATRESSLGRWSKAYVVVLVKKERQAGPGGWQRGSREGEDAR